MICRRCAVRLQLLQGGKQGAVVGVLAERAGCILRCERPDSRISFFCQRCGGDIGSGGAVLRE